MFHLTFSSSGGAGRVAHSLATAQRALGWESSVIRMTERNLFSRPFDFPVHTLAAGIDNYVVKKQNFSPLFSLFRDRLSSTTAKGLSKADVIHLHWINGFVDPALLREQFPSVPIVWTLHDMNPFTGGCHQSLRCKQYERSCATCPAVHTTFHKAVQNNLARKKEMLDVENLRIVAPTAWMASVASQSTVLKGRMISVVPNPVNERFLADDHVSGAKRDDVFLLIASDTRDPLKRVTFGVECFTAFRRTNPNAALVVVGKHATRFHRVPGVEAFESLQPSELAQQLERAVGLLVPSEAETAPLVLSEAGCVGTMAIVNNIPALASMISLLGKGHMASTKEEWINTMKMMCVEKESRDQREELASKARGLFSPTAVAQKYSEIYEEAL